MQCRHLIESIQWDHDVLMLLDSFPRLLQYEEAPAGCPIPLEHIPDDVYVLLSDDDPL